jgi:hypothetical protein
MSRKNQLRVTADQYVWIRAAIENTNRGIGAHVMNEKMSEFVWSLKIAI